jgi:NAD(P)-dependent dehydrogenase (short-subunit alcohol dehydrogenase family)
MDLHGRTALVTGAGHRVGRAIALALAARGMRVAVHYNAAAKEAEETARQISALGGEPHLFGADLTDASVPEKLIADVTKTCGTLDVLVNSAAVMHRMPFDQCEAVG